MKIMESEQSIIEPPDIDDPKKLDEWLETHITIPSASFADPRAAHADGTLLTDEEKVAATRIQVRLGVKGLQQLGKPEATIVEYVMRTIPQPSGQHPDK